MARQYYELGVRVAVSSFPMECVFHGFIDSPSVANEFEVARSIVAALDDGGAPTSWIHRFIALMSSDAYISTIRCRRITDGGGNTSEAFFQVDDFPGSVSSPVSATQVASCVIWNSTEAPDKTGRNFIPAVPASMIANGRFVAGHQTAVNNFVTKSLTGLAVSAGTFLFCYWNALAEVGYQFTGGYLSPKPGTQRRREVVL